MNTFVRDGAVIRKRRARQSLSARSTEPERKKIYRAHNDGATSARRDLALSTLQIHSGESSVNQSKVAAEKESRYSNVEFTRAKAFLYLNYKKISSSNVNKLLKEHLKKFDGNETHLKRTFEQCYDLTGSVEKSKAMMKQLATNTCSRLDLIPNLSSGVSERRLSILPCKVVEKTVKKHIIIKNKKSRDIRLKENIDNRNLTMFGKENSSTDKTIIYTTKLNDYIKEPIIDFDSDSTIVSDDEEIGKRSCMLTKAYSLRPDKGAIVRISSNLIKNNPQSNTICAKKSISTTSLSKTSVHKKFKKGSNICDTGDSKISASNMNNLEEINSQLNTDASIQNAESFALETGNHVGQIIIPQLKIDGIIKNSKVPAFEKNVEGENTVAHRNSEGPVLAQNIDDEETPPLVIDEFVENAESTVLETDVGEIMVSKLITEENVQSSNRTILETNTLVRKTIDLELEKSTSYQDLANSQIDTDIDDSKKQCALETDVGEDIVPKLMDKHFENTHSTALEINVERENTVPHENSEDPVLTQNIDDEETHPLVIDEFVENAESTVLETDVGEIMVSKLITEENVQSSNRTILETNTLVRKTIDLELEKFSSNPDLANCQIETNIDDSKKQSALETDVGEVMVPKLMDKYFENAHSTALKINVEGENTFAHRSSKGPVLAQNIDDEDTPPLVIDEFVENAESTVLKTDVGEIMVSKLTTEENVQSSNRTILEMNTLVGKIIDLELEKSTSDQGLVNSQINELKIDTYIDDSKKQSAFETDVGNSIIDENVQSSNSTILETNSLVGKIIDQELEKSISHQDLANYKINELHIDTDIDDLKNLSEILDHTNLVLKIRKIINTDDEVFKSSIIKDLATYFLNDDFLYKVDALWKTTESELVGELIIKLLNMFNDIKYNMAQFTGCLICIFREIAQKSSILPCQLKLKLIVFLDAVKKYIKFHDNALWRTWFLPSMFFDWCFTVASIFMNTKNEFKIDFNKSILRNATAYYKMVRRCAYLFINQDLKPSKSHKKSGIFELTRIDDLLEIDDIHATNDPKVIPNISIDIPLNDLKRKKLKTDDTRIDTINHTTSGNIEKVCLAPVDPKIPKIIVRPQFNYSNSFVNKLNWFNNNVSDLMKKFNVSTSNESIESSIVQNNTTYVDNNKVPSSVSKRRCVVTNENKPTQSKKSKTLDESPRVFFTIANNPKEFDISYGSSAIAQKSRSSAVSKNVSSSSTVPNNLSSSAAVPQSLVPSTVSHNLSPYYNHYSSSNTSSQLPVTSQTVASRSLSVYYNNINSNITQAPIGLPSLSNTTQSSDANTNPSLNINRTSIIYPPQSNNHRAIHHQSSAATNSQRPKAATTWPSNKYTNMCSDPSCSKSSTYTTQYTNSAASSYSQSTYSHNIPSAISHPQYSNALTYPTTYTNPLLSDLLASNTAGVASMNTYMQHQSYNYSNSYSSQNNLKTPDHNTQVSPDLPDARLPNMPNHLAADTINQMCMAANCTNFSSFSCNTCLAAFYCSIQCQKSDWHYHQNECCVSY
ncbi:uncharacterized protein LOC100575277 isoform X2 [Acyrthosiphon pisum]|uniref:MYND-type domain-containing protein n=1 Tax=Acyrthosiphon pisum TaxID=7029 RepID=A0A8R2H5B8_ACYPI|nr:uncharacterized protein LOC100575277 isoform X2 [Acyrthosiphon pisum]|eukprot:XP_016656254.1 PREDICTED: uncharacterized protein LOC100575277 isoform X2 [Acyrthosiphon pisum]